MKNIENDCPCYSGETYGKCCKRLHDGELPENALQLMRSRYSAYALNIPEYIIKTSHPANLQYSEDKFFWKQSISQFSQSTLFQKLDILDFQENDTLATVTFRAQLSQQNRDTSFTEKSYFKKINDQWLYLSGQML